MKSKMEFYESLDDIISSSQWLQKIPFEHTFRNVPHQTFVSRLIQEQWLFTEEKLSTLPLLTIIIFSNEWEEFKFEQTFESCILQSAPIFRIAIICQNPQILSLIQSKVKGRLTESQFLQDHFQNRVAYYRSFDEFREDKDEAGEFIVGVKKGDILHPSFVTSFYREVWRETSTADIYVCNETIITYAPHPSAVRFLRKPNYEPYTLFHFNYISYSFICRASLIIDYKELETYFHENQCHLFLLEMLVVRKCKAITIPQYLLLRDASNIKGMRSCFEPFISIYKKFFQRLEFTLKELAGEVPYALVPNRNPGKISVIIPFRDKPELTCKSIDSVLNQKVDCLIEIILINNQSQQKSIEYIYEFIDQKRTSLQNIILIDYDFPFNHSAQCNLGAKEAKGECIVFFNNDAQLNSPEALTQIAAWSLLPTVGTVGVRITGKEKELLSAGIAMRLAPGQEYKAAVEESKDKQFSGFNRETWGNTFACVGVSKKTFDTVGLLDEVNFPIGYNDVDYNMRCKKASLSNVYLGTLTAIHVPGSSRKSADELYEKILLRQKYPEFFSHSLFQLQTENRPLTHPISFKLSIDRYIKALKINGPFVAILRVLRYFVRLFK